MSNHNYKVVESNENPLESIIEKSGITATFSIQQLIQEGKQMQKKLEEVKGQLTLEEAKAQNVATNHAFVVDATPEEIERAHHIAFFNEIKKGIETYKQLQKIYEEGIEANNAEIAEIKKQVGIDSIIDDLVEDAEN